MKTLSSQLMDMLKSSYPEFVHSVALEDYARSLGFKSSNSGRRLRELYNEGKIEREYRLHEGVRIVWYKYKVQSVERISDFIGNNLTQYSLQL